jgi:hypothetical protein
VHESGRGVTVVTRAALTQPVVVPAAAVVAESLPDDTIDAPP